MTRILMIVGMVGLGWWLLSVGKWYTTATDEVYFFDIGQGDAGLVIKSSPCMAKICLWLHTYNVTLYERTTVLIDGGPDDKVVRELSKVLPWWKRSLDLVVVTHPHQDHIGGLLFVNERFAVRQVLMNPVSYTQSHYNILLDQWGVCAPSSIAGAQVVTRSDRRKAGHPTFISSSESMRRYPWLRVLLPLDDSQPLFDGDRACWQVVVRPGSGDTINNDSIVIMTTLGSKETIVWSGDSEAPAEKVFLETRHQLFETVRPISILKAPHHCSHSASTPEFVSVVRPQLVICSVGEGNPYEHPHRDIVERYQQSGSEVWRTDTQGTKHVTLRQ